jgi:protein translocase SEC61 complex gamma subunit
MEENKEEKIEDQQDDDKPEPEPEPQPEPQPEPPQPEPTPNPEPQPVTETTPRKKPIIKKPDISLPKFNFNFKNIPMRFMNAMREYRRVIIVSKKPDMEELSKITKVAGIGIAIIGLIGFSIQIVFQLLVRGV